ncbi:hypothetical protein SAMN06297144_1884 [Sphingomonas guangdongensis]|uniref:Uncharacterized protein n=1 Tax=Sphingomonas guangdongensis TaxID=1141890 RepID=A0A285QXS6_9SPHN|nr:hypothetical protein [Sphingomonas guangdongensis]SOB86775.1 hypothetical protein SAMN06297144_1884 [Sphingomonas guangdongensis]
MTDNTDLQNAYTMVHAAEVAAVEAVSDALATLIATLDTVAVTLPANATSTAKQLVTRVKSNVSSVRDFDVMNVMRTLHPDSGSIPPVV